MLALTTTISYTVILVINIPSIGLIGILPEQTLPSCAYPTPQPFCRQATAAVWFIESPSVQTPFHLPATHTSRVT